MQPKTQLTISYTVISSSTCIKTTIQTTDLRTCTGNCTQWNMLVSKSHPYVNTGYFVSRSCLNAVVPIVQIGKLRQIAIKGDAWGHVLGLAISRGIWILNSYLYFLTTKPRSSPVQVQFQVQGLTRKTGADSVRCTFRLQCFSKHSQNK